MTEVEVVDLRGVLKALANSLATVAGGVTAEEVEGRLMERERLGSTRVAAGVAMPHCRCQGVQRPAVSLLRTREPLLLEGEKIPGRLFLGVVTPAEEPSGHLRVLAELSRRVREPGRLESMLEAPTGADMLGAWERPADAAA